MTHEIQLMTEKEKMLAGLIYSAVDEELLKELNEVKDIIHKYNSLLPSASQERLLFSRDCWAIRPMMSLSSISHSIATMENKSA